MKWKENKTLARHDNPSEVIYLDSFHQRYQFIVRAWGKLKNGLDSNDTMTSLKMKK